MKLEIEEIEYKLRKKNKNYIRGHFRRYERGQIHLLSMDEYLDIVDGNVVDMRTGELLLWFDELNRDHIIPYTSDEWEVDIEINNKTYTNKENILYVLKCIN